MALALLPAWHAVQARLLQDPATTAAETKLLQSMTACFMQHQTAALSMTGYAEQTNQVGS